MDPQQQTPQSQYHPDPTPEQRIAQQAASRNATEVIAPTPSFTWQASEFVHHEKPASWYLALMAVAVVLAGTLAVLQQWFGVVVVVAAALAVVVYSRKEPRTLEYALDEHGISINGVVHPYKEFHSYSVLPEVGWREIDLEPAKRFAPRVTLLTEDASFDQIEGILAHQLPRQDREPDMIEKLTRYLKF